MENKGKGPQTQHFREEITSGDTSLITTTVVVFLVALLLWRSRARGREMGDKGRGKTSSLGATSQCQSPNCLRCHGEAVIKGRLMQRCKDYVLKEKGIAENAEEYLSRSYPRVVSLIASIERKNDILRSVYRESGYKVELSESEPHIWTLPELKRAPVWNISFHNDLELISSVLKDGHVFETIQGDFERISLQGRGWNTNSIPSGKWSVFHLFNQGTKVEDNCTLCPQTVAFIESIPGFMRGNTFGNAMFSILEPGSHIEAHTGPCNFRLRCHLPLLAPRGYKIRVGLHTVSWQAGRLLVFDDSFVHSVWHEEGDWEERKRVLLIFDVWHPHVDQHERNLLDNLFDSGQ